MMEIDDFFELGHFTKTSGHKGEITAFFDVDEPEKYFGLDMIIVDLPEGLIPFTVKNIQYRNKNKFRLRLEGIETIEDAQNLVKRKILLPLAALPKLSGNQFYYHEVIGWQVVDDHYGPVGIIEHINDSGNNPLFIIKKENKEVLLPIFDKFLGRVDRDEQIIHYSAPEGLIDLYLSDQKDDQEL